MTTPVSITPAPKTWDGATLKVGSLAFEAGAGNFTGSRLVIVVGTRSQALVTLDTDEADGLSWSSGTLGEWELTPEQVATVAAVTRNPYIFVYIAEASPSDDVTLVATGKAKIVQAPGFS